MPVTVGFKELNGRAGENEHSEGKCVVVRDGNLFVQNAYDAAVHHTIAVYAPGAWLYGHTETE